MAPRGAALLRAAAWTVVAVLVAAGAWLWVGPLHLRLIDVEGGSMQPAIANGSLLLTSRQPRGQVRAGEVVSVRGEDGVRVTHRVVGSDPATGGVLLKGDANTTPDVEPYVVDHVDHVRLVIPGLGVAARGARMFLTTNPVLDGCLLVLLAAVLWPSRRPAEVTLSTTAGESA